MKKLLYMMGCLCVLVFVQTACSPQFEDLFDKSASERLEESLENAGQVLVSAEKGWAMGYFPNNSTRGYMLFAKFAADGQVTLADYNNKGLTSTSTYSMNISQGPVLNFDTYSDVLAHYTNPGTWLEGATGNAGDFEFVIFSVSEDEVVLKGKLYGAKAVLRKITGDGEMHAEWEAYHNSCEKMVTKFFVAGVSPVLTFGKDTVYRLDNASSRIFEMYSHAIKEDENKSLVPFVVSPEGVVDLALDVQVGTWNVRSFVYDEAKTALVNKENGDIQIVAPDMYANLANSGLRYLAGKDNLTGKYKAAFDDLALEFNTRYGGARDLETVGFMVKNGKIVFVLNTKGNIALFTLPGEVKSDRLVIELFDATAFPVDNMDKNAKLFYDQVASLKDFLKLLPGEYMLANTGGLTVSSMEMKSLADKNDKFILMRK